MHGDLGSPPADGIVAARRDGIDTGLEQRQLLERTAVQRQIAHLPFIDQSAEGSGGQIDAFRVGHHTDLGACPSDLESEIDHGFLPYCQVDAFAHHGLKPGRGNA